MREFLLEEKFAIVCKIFYWIFDNVITINLVRYNLIIHIGHVIAHLLTATAVERLTQIIHLATSMRLQEKGKQNYEGVNTKNFLLTQGR
jgi:hypothetical protein